MEDTKRDISPYDLQPIFELLDKAQKRLEDLLVTNKRAEKSNILPADYIINGLCEYYGISKHELRTRRRNKDLVRRRRFAAKLLRTYTKCTLEGIATILGYKSHRTILYHIGNIDEQLSKNYYGYVETKTEYKLLLKHLKL